MGHVPDIAREEVNINPALLLQGHLVFLLIQHVLLSTISGAGTTLGPWDTLVNKRSASTDLTYFHQNTNRVCTFFVTRCTYIQCISWYRCCLAKSKMRECIWALKEAKNLGIFFEYNVLILTAIIFFTEELGIHGILNNLY